MERARQIIYSIMMGFVLKYYLEHSSSIMSTISSLQSKDRIFYIMLLVYFFMNCFRYLFGIFRLTLMTDSLYEPQKEDWIKSKFFFNLKRLFVLNSGLFQVILFGILVILLFPHSEEGFEWRKIYLNQDAQIMISKHSDIDWRDIVSNFFILNIIIVFVDVITTYTFVKTVVKTTSPFDKGERLSCRVWIRTGITELVFMIACLLLLCLKKEIFYSVTYISLISLFLLLCSEILGVWKYAIHKMIKKQAKNVDN